MLTRLTQPLSAPVVRAAQALLAIAVAVALLPLGAATTARADAQGLEVRIAPAITGNTGVRDGQRIAISGEAPEGAGEGSISAGRLIAVHDGGTLSSPLSLGTLNRGHSDAQDGVQVADGQLHGRLTLSCLFGLPDADCNAGRTITDVRLELTVAGQTEQSPELRIDFTRPVIREYRLVARDLVRVVFSEPVIHPDGERITDWQVESDDSALPITVIDVLPAMAGDCEYGPGEDDRPGDTGCTRGLRLSRNVHEDATPFLRYILRADPVLPGTQDRVAHRDYASNLTHRASGSPESGALNLVRPALPSVERVAGKAPTGDGAQVSANVEAPVVRVGNLTSGHDVFFRVTRPDGTVLSTESDPFTAPSSGAHDISLPDITTGDSGDGAYLVQPIARDPHGNLSTDSGKSPPREDGNPNVVSYLLDRVPPVILSASQTAPREITVQLSEDVTPSGNAGVWQVNDQQVSAGGSGDTRVLSPAFDVSSGDTVSWAPNGGSTYHDAADNELVPRAGLPLSVLPPVSPPTVTVPGAEVYTRDDSVQVGGTRPAGTAVQVLRAGQDDVVAEAPPNGTGWSVSAPLGQDGRHRFEARARNPETGIRSGRVAVPDVVRDTRPPQVDVTEPSLKPLSEAPLSDRRREYTVGDVVTVQWQASDPAPGGEDNGDRVDLDIRIDGDARHLASPPYQADETTTYEYTVTETDLAGLGSRVARFGVTVTDKAGNVTEEVSAEIILVEGLIGYAAGFTEPASVSNIGQARIAVRFPYPMSGNTNAAHWDVRERQGEATSDRLVTEASKAADEDGNTVVVLRVQGVQDPNAVLEARHDENPDTGAVSQPLRGPDGQRKVTPAWIDVADEVLPALAITRPSGGPLNAASVTLRGQTDETGHPNTVRVHRVGSDGARTEVVKTAAGTNGSFEVNVPLRRNATNNLVVQATDPSGNPSPERTFSVVEDSIAPKVTIASPKASSRLPSTVPIRWTTDDEHPSYVEIDYRVDDGGWHQIVVTEDTGRFDWERPEIDEDARVRIRVTAYDEAFNSGQASVDGLFTGLVPPGGGTPIPGTEITVGAIATSERTIELNFGEAVTLSSAPAGLSVRQGPGVRSISGSGTKWVLELNTDLETNRPTVVYNGNGITTSSGAPAAAFVVQATRGFAFAVQGLGGAATAPESIRLSWVDDRNVLSEVVRYEVRRDGQLVAELPRDARGYLDAAAGRQERTYQVITVDDMGHRSTPATTTIDPLAPNITPLGGFVLSEDGEVALIVPPGAVDRDHFGTLAPVTGVSTDGYRHISSGYALRARAADDRTPLEAFNRYSCLSFRPGYQRLDQTERARLMGLRLGAGESAEIATRAGHGSASSCILTLGDFALGEAHGVTTRVFGPDPAFHSDRFATAAGLSQTAFGQAGEAILARHDDFPDALASAALAEQVGAPILLATPNHIPPVTMLELQRLGVERVTLVGGTAALGQSVAAQAQELGLQVRRVAGDNRFETAVAVAQETGAFGGAAYLATGQDFADALSASSSSAYLGRPVFLVTKDLIPTQTLDGLRELGITSLDVLGGVNAIDASVEAQLQAEGLSTRRIAGVTRFETALELARQVRAEGMDLQRPLAASGQGSGKTSPDALASGPVAARFGSPLLLVARDFLHDSVGQVVGEAQELRGITIAGGPVAVSVQTRQGLDAAAR